MKENYRILLIGNLYNNHMVRFVRNLKQTNPKAIVDGFEPFQKGICFPAELESYFNECKLVEFSNNFESFPVLRSIELIMNWKKCFRSFAKGRHYDIVNIHFPMYLERFILDDIKRITNRIVLTPWGSDVYRISNGKRAIVKKIYDCADFVTGAGGRFTQDFMRIYDIPIDKFVKIGIGSETIDYISENKPKLSTEEAKNRLGIGGYYTISCGYNASSAQRHLQIIESIVKVKHMLPKNLMLLFPVTYPQAISYIAELKKTVDYYGLHAMWFDKYMDVSSLFELIMATDLFIHIQTTDANSASLKEYILCEKNCINGSWLKYDDLEEDGVKPFHVVDHLAQLDQVIIDAYKKGAPKISNNTLHVVESLGCKPTSVKWNNFFMNISK